MDIQCKGVVFNIPKAKKHIAYEQTDIWQVWIDSVSLSTCNSKLETNVHYVLQESWYILKLTHINIDNVGKIRYKKK